MGSSPFKQIMPDSDTFWNGVVSPGVMHEWFVLCAVSSPGQPGLLSFAVGGLLGDVFLHLLPEAWNNHLACKPWIKATLSFVELVSENMTNGYLEICWFCPNLSFLVLSIRPSELCECGPMGHCGCHHFFHFGKTVSWSATTTEAAAEAKTACWHNQEHTNRGPLLSCSKIFIQGSGRNASQLTC